MASANIYLTYDGNCEEAFEFYKSVIGGEFSYLGRFKDVPIEEGQKPVSKENENKIMHISYPIGDRTVLMATDKLGEWSPSDLKVGNNFSIYLSVNSKEDADKYFNGLSTGGNITMPMQNTFWGSYFGMFEDKYRVNWMIGYDEPQGE